MRANISRFASIIGFHVLAFLTLLLFVLSLTETINPHIALTLVKALIVSGLAFEVIREWKRTAGLRAEGTSYSPSDFFNFLSVFGGAVITFFISVGLGHSAVVASGIVGIAGAAVLKKYAVPIFCGSFVGMASPAVFISYPCIITAGLIAAVLFVLAKDVFNGFGGKLGTIAFGGCITASLVIGAPLLRITAPGWDVGWMIVLYSIIGAVATFSISVRLGHGPVMASGIVGLTTGLLLPALHGPELGGTLAVMVFCASFAGMSGTARFKNELPIALAGLFCGLIFIYSSPFLGGAGGKLGTIAFGSVIAVRGLMTIAPSVYKGVCRGVTLFSVLPKNEALSTRKASSKSISPGL